MSSSLVSGLINSFANRKMARCSGQSLRRIFGPKRDGVTGGWRKQHNEELHNLYSSPIIIRIIKSRRMRWGGPCGTNGGEEDRV
jgi:hypothetical protein